MIQYLKISKYLADQQNLSQNHVNAERRKVGFWGEIWKNITKILMVFSGLTTSCDCHNVQDIEYKLCR